MSMGWKVEGRYQSLINDYRLALSNDNRRGVAGEQSHGNKMLDAPKMGGAPPSKLGKAGNESSKWT